MGVDIGARRVERVPSKYQSAIFAAEIGTAMVYRRPLEPDFAAALEAYAGQVFA